MGFGDYAPTTQKSRLFTIFVVMFGVAIIAVALVEIASFFLEAKEALVARSTAALLKSSGGAPMDPEIEAKLAKSKPSGGGGSSNPISALLGYFPVLVPIGYLAGYAFAFGALFAYIEDWTLIDGLYFSVITGTSIGYGEWGCRKGVRLESSSFVLFHSIDLVSQINTSINHPINQSFIFFFFFRLVERILPLSFQAT